ncbi:hypothetical protein PENANT_c107G05204 [Penicillium antarcticum]|uniref:Uncharacterized protein n=1 Tax=Penicillium antarcticum TaxID=416450 RepID=A0A1V6PL07_9EURO|nr:hypothetical protein PENANT_c107G05204 [Penicillium antarcticum]
MPEVVLTDLSDRRATSCHYAVTIVPTLLPRSHGLTTTVGGWPNMLKSAKVMNMNTWDLNLNAVRLDQLPD